MKSYVALHALVLVLLTISLAHAEVFQAGGAALVTTQNGDGGWDWPFLEQPLNLSNAPNIVAPTTMGLLAAYQQTADPNQLAALEKAARYFLQKRPYEITPEDGYLAVALDKAFGVTSHTDFLKAKFYNPLAAGTYDFAGDGSMLVDTRWYIVLLRMGRAAQGVPNLAAVDLGMGLYSATLVGADTSAWLAGVKAEINEMKVGELFDVFGLAASVLGLASVGAEFDPKYGDYAAAGSLADLAATLASYQLATGGFTWNGYLMDEGVENEEVQETAVALLALGQFSRDLYADNIAKAATYLKGVQLPSGDWENFSGSGANNEVTGEALWAIGSTVPIPEKPGN